MKIVSMTGVLTCLVAGGALATEVDTQPTVKKPIEILLFNALPGSGKSETRKYLNTFSVQERRAKFGIGEMVEIDDFPYVFFMRCVSDEMVKLGYEGPFFRAPVFPFSDAREWGTLDELINMDYDDMVAGKKYSVDSAATWLFDRIDTARVANGLEPVFKKLDTSVRAKLAQTLEPRAAKVLREKGEAIPASVAGKTVVIEFSRGGADGAAFPLPAPYGYQYTLSKLSPAILERAAILYIWVTPEESRRKNEKRANPNDPGSSLNHTVPLAVMYVEYGCDDMHYLLSISDKPHTVRIAAHGKTYYLPCGVVDNRVDKTTFVHKDVSQWTTTEIAALHKVVESGLREINQ